MDLIRSAGLFALASHVLAGDALCEADRRVMVIAPTGIAALNVDGYTIHRLFGFRP